MRFDACWISENAIKVILLIAGLTLHFNLTNPVIERKTTDNTQRDCIIEALWHEARGERIEGIHAVASVIANRADTRRDPKDFCSLIREPKQFSYIAQKSAEALVPKVNSVEKHKHAEIVFIAESMLLGTFVRTLPKEVMWYTEKRVRTVWMKRMKTFKVIGSHRFFSLK